VRPPDRQIGFGAGGAGTEQRVEPDEAGIAGRCDSGRRDRTRCLYLAGGVNWRAGWAFIERYERAITEFKAHLKP